MKERKFYAIADTIYHDGRPVLGAFFGRNGKLKELLDKLAALMTAADFEVEPEWRASHTWDDFSFDFEEKRNKVKNALDVGAPVFMAEIVGPSSSLVERKAEEPDDPWLKPGTSEYAKWMEDEFKAGGQL